MLTEMPPPKIKRFSVILGILHCLSQYSPDTVEMSELLRILKSVKVDLIKTYEVLFNISKALIVEDAFMMFSNEKESLYLETDASGVGLGVGLLQV